MGLLIALAILAFFIVFHELGHFLVARACGVKVEVFSLGFGKKLFTFDYRGTQYAISVIPLGGYVQLKGQQEAFETSCESIESNPPNRITESKQSQDSNTGNVCARSGVSGNSLATSDTNLPKGKFHENIESNPPNRITESKQSQDSNTGNVCARSGVSGNSLATSDTNLPKGKFHENIESNPPNRITESKQSQDSFLAKSPLARIAILLAGSGFNILLGFLLYVCVCLYGITSVPPIVGEVVDSMPAQEAGLVRGDKILAINGTEIRTWEELSKIVRDSEGMIALRVQRGDILVETTLTPRLVQSHNIFGEIVWHNAIGISAAQQTQIVRYTGLQAITKAWEKTIEASRLILQSLQKLVSGVIGAQHISSIVGITHTMSSFAQSDLIAFLSLSALISINLGIFNLLPIPPLDGGHILFTLYETLMRKRVNARVANAIMIAGLALLLGVMTLGVYNDINRIIAP